MKNKIIRHIHVDAELDGIMREITEFVNWSGVAEVAFKKKLLEIKNVDQCRNELNQWRKKWQDIADQILSDDK